MGEVKTLRDLAGRLGSLDPKLTIYLRPPWTSSSPSMVAMEPLDGAIRN